MDGATLLAVDVEARGDELVAGVPCALFDGPYSTTQDLNYNVFPDGEHFLMIEADADSEPSRLHLAVNWFEEVTRLFPDQ